MVLAEMVPSTPPTHEFVASQLHKAVYEVSAMSWRVMGTDQGGPSSPKKKIQGDPRYALLLACTNEEIEVSMMPGDMW